MSRSENSRPDIHGMTVPELLELKREIEDLVAEKREVELGRLRDEMSERAEALGVTLDMLVAKKRGRKSAANGAHAG